jgi:signal transduction histidine kinase
MQDITNRRKAEIELETVRQERMNLQEQFLSHVSHELRTPLTAIYFFITNLLDGVAGNLTSGQRETLEFSLENVKQLKDTVSDLLDVSRIETLKLTFANARLVTEARNMPNRIDHSLLLCSRSRSSDLYIRQRMKIQRDSRNKSGAPRHVLDRIACVRRLGSHVRPQP